MRVASGPHLRLSAAAFAAVVALLPASTRCAQAQASYRIAGRVVNSTTGDPVRRVTVAALSQDSSQAIASAVTDAEGNFKISGLAPGKYPLSASRRGFRTSYFDEHDGFNSAIVTGPGQDTEHLVFQIAPGAVIYGTVTDDNGDPVENAQIMVFRQDTSAPESHPKRAQGATTDDTGAYEISNLAAGEYFVAVGAQPWYTIRGRMDAAAPGENSLDVAYPVTFFDSTADEGAASAIDIAAGERAEADISLHAVPAIRIKLTGPRRHNGGPGASLRQTVFGEDFPAQVEMEGNENGLQIVGLAPGRYHMETSNPPRSMDFDATSNMDIDPSSGTPLQPVDGTVRMTDGSAPGEISLVLMRPDGGARASAIVQNGRFRFDAVPPGSWTLGAARLGAGYKQLYVASIQAAGSSGKGGRSAGTEIAVSDHPVTVTLTLTATETRIDGFARKDGKGVSGVMIVLVPLGKPARDPSAYISLVRRDQSDSDGSFSLRDVAPGHYTVVAIQDGWHIDWQDPNVMARYLPGGQPVTIDTESGTIFHLPKPVEAVSP